MYRIINNSPIRLSHMAVSMEQVLEAIESANHKLKAISDYTKELSLDIFRILDLRTLSGAVGETFVGEMSRIVPGLMKNPSLDGYPDLVQCAAPEMAAYFEEYASRDSKEAFLFILSLSPQTTSTEHDIFFSSCLKLSSVIDLHRLIKSVF